MQQAHERQLKCQRCGGLYSAAEAVCPLCGRPAPASGEAAGPSGDWERTRNSLKTRWVVSVLAFWVSVVVLGVVFLIDGRLDPILVSIALGLLILGITLKTRYQVHLRKEPGRQ